MQIIDTHNHAYFGHFDKYRKEMIINARRHGVVGQIQIGCDEISSLAAVELAKKNDDFFATIGLHPCDVAPMFEGGFENHRIEGFADYKRTCENVTDLFEFFEELYEKEKDVIVGFGETGFDRYHDKRDELVEWQREAFVRHLELCRKYGKPVVIHTRNSTRELLDFLEQNAYFFRGGNGVRGVVHCFCEDYETAKTLTEKYGLYLGLGGVVTYQNTAALQEAVQKIPAKFLLTETDAPFLAPVKFKKANGKINDPSALPEIVEKIAEIRDEDPEKLAEILYQNAQNLFGI